MLARIHHIRRLAQAALGGAFKAPVTDFQLPASKKKFWRSGSATRSSRRAARRAGRSDGVLGEVADSETLGELIVRETLATELTRVKESAAPSLAHVKADVIDKERVTTTLEPVS